MIRIPAGRRLGGSSPHTRGAQDATNVFFGGRRIIPAYAGSTPTTPRSGRPQTDHPRIRGEHVTLQVIFPAIFGSSPHTRGAQPDRHPGVLDEGIIPAYAGSTSTLASPFPSPTDHPRIRGEHLKLLGQALLKLGSSPHTRGAPVHAVRPPGRRRIIPAYAGSTASTPGERNRSRDHPRIRGEHSVRSTRERTLSGSSPHTRGARADPGPARQRRGIIPAYAGSTMPGCASPKSPPDHPRIRGEHCRVLYSRNWTRGIIPAYAGSTAPSSPACWAATDHPRIRGEHCGDGGEADAAGGSSPHTRGARANNLPARRHQMDHPRIRGEHGSSPAREGCHQGSSPHTRGARRRLLA